MSEQPVSGASSSVGSARRLSAIRDALGEGALRLAYHAAVPVVVDADLLNLLRVNFFLDDPPDVLPFEVEAELLLSPLFREIGEGLYEIDPGLRNLLLSGLHTRYGPERVRRVAALLEQYTDAAAAWRSLPELELAQQLTALSFLDPAGAERWLDVHEASATRPSSSSAPSADDGPGREWYIAMRRRVAENSDITTIDTEIRYAGEALLQLLSRGDISARLSVIRSLESLASLPDTDADEVVTVLCTFIQQWDERSPGPSKRVTLDVQAALSLIGSLPHIEFRLDGVALRGANLAGLDFSYAIFNLVMLTELDARALDLSYAQFTDVVLSDANLDGAFLDEAFLEFRTLRQVSLGGVSLEGAYIAADTIQGVTGSLADGTPLEIRSPSAENETTGFSTVPGRREEPATEAPEPELPESDSPDSLDSVRADAERAALMVSVRVKWADQQVRQVDKLRDDEQYWVIYVLNSSPYPLQNVVVTVTSPRDKFSVDWVAVEPGHREWYILRPSNSDFPVHGPIPKASAFFEVLGIKWQLRDGSVRSADGAARNSLDSVRADAERAALMVSVRVERADQQVRQVDKLRDDEQYWVLYVQNSSPYPLQNLVATVTSPTYRFSVNWGAVEPGNPEWYILRPSNSNFPPDEPAPKASAFFEVLGIKWQLRDGKVRSAR